MPQRCLLVLELDDELLSSVEPIISRIQSQKPDAIER